MVRSAVLKTKDPSGIFNDLEALDELGIYLFIHFSKHNIKPRKST